MDSGGRRIVSTAEIDAWVAEAEAGYDVDMLRQRGRPTRGMTASSVVAIRFDEQELANLDTYAQTHGLSRSDAVRRAVSEMITRAR